MVNDLYVLRTLEEQSTKTPSNKREGLQPSQETKTFVIK
jgi:hypothetical protein